MREEEGAFQEEGYFTALMSVVEHLLYTEKWRRVGKAAPPTRNG